MSIFNAIGGDSIGYFGEYGEMKNIHQSIGSSPEPSSSEASETDPYDTLSGRDLIISGNARELVRDVTEQVYKRCESHFPDRLSQIGENTIAHDIHGSIGQIPFVDKAHNGAPKAPEIPHEEFNFPEDVFNVPIHEYLG